MWLSKSYKLAYLKLTYGLSSIEYRDATLPNSYLVVKGLIMKRLKSIGQF